MIQNFKSENSASSSTTKNSFSTENTFSSLWLIKMNRILCPYFPVIKIHQIERNGETALLRSHGRALIKNSGERKNELDFILILCV